MHALVGETGIKKASLYAAFGNKQQMYLAALDRYIEREVGFAVDLLTVTSQDGGVQAIAGLFAGVLDEVEAALDDANLHRFLRLVGTLRGTSQLVIVTHQQQTMEAADVLYGVTMEPGESSRVLAKRMSDLVPQA